MSDQNKAAVPNVVVTALNIETGSARAVNTDEKGGYRFPLLPLGKYRLTVETSNFKTLVRDGITLATGQIATIDLNLQPGELREVVTVSSDSSVVDVGKTDLGRVMGTREVRNLPLVSLNPYNFALLQGNVTGRPSRGFAPPSVNANGYARRVNFLLDGNSNNQGDRTSVRFMLVSETFVSEVQLLTSGFAAEFGNTPGLIMNVVTSSGTNKTNGAIGYKFRRPAFYSRPFFFPASSRLPDNKVDDLTFTVGGPFIKGRWHYYFGYENSSRDDKAVAVRLLTIPADARRQLIEAGLPASIFPTAIPFLEAGTFYLFRTDAQLNDKNRLSVRLNHADLTSKNGIQGGLNTLERSIDVFSIDHALALQLATYSPHILNELRFQYAYVQRTTGASGRRNEFSGLGPSVVITGVANFGSPEAADTIFLPRRITQGQDNISRITGTHVVKFGGGFNFSNNSDRLPIFSKYTFRSVDAYLAARDGSNQRSYTNYAQTLGNPEIKYKATFWNFFVQDDWKLKRRLKINYGLRYDLYQIPKADSASPFAASQKFKVDKNNFAPRFGIVFALGATKHPTIFRVGAGMYYDQPALVMYQRALQNNGSLKYFSLTLRGNDNGMTIPSPNAPTFPYTFSGSLPPGTLLPRQNIDTIAPDFENMYAIHSNVQVEQAITDNFSFSLGYIRSSGRHLAVYRSLNLIPCRYLGDGRPVFLCPPNPVHVIDTRFNNITSAESTGSARYNALVAHLTKRFTRGLQFSVNYTLSKGEDDAPEQNLATTNQGLILSDPYNRGLDKGRSFADQRHTFVMSLVSRPMFGVKSHRIRSIINGNQIGIIATANSGETFNIVSTSDINGDGNTGSDRPVGIRRNSGTTPHQFNVDSRFSRFFKFNKRYQLEVFGEFINLFNINSIVQYNNVTVMTNVNGELVGGLPDFLALHQSTSQESRQFQIGVKFLF